MLEKSQAKGVCLQLEFQSLYSLLVGPSPSSLQPFRDAQILSSECIAFYVHVLPICLLGFAPGDPVFSCYRFCFPFPVTGPVLLFFLQRTQFCLTLHVHFSCHSLGSGPHFQVGSICSLGQYLGFESSQRAFSSLSSHGHVIHWNMQTTPPLAMWEHLLLSFSL